jgi:hypothetical protein
VAPVTLAFVTAGSLFRRLIENLVVIVTPPVGSWALGVWRPSVREGKFVLSPARHVHDRHRQPEQTVAAFGREAKLSSVPFGAPADLRERCRSAADRVVQGRRDIPENGFPPVDRGTRQQQIPLPRVAKKGIAMGKERDDAASYADWMVGQIRDVNERIIDMAQPRGEAAPET